ncbi:MAG: hypothetical protein AB7V22_03260 [Kiritimatiellia bacterium]
MKNQSSAWRRAALAALSVLAVAISGCGGGSDDGESTVDVSGTWTGSSSNDPRVTAVLVQNGDTVTGTLDGVPLTGSVDGSQVEMTVPGGEGDVVTIEGTVDGDVMSGTWESTDGETGTWTVTKT